jgi:Tfp pilus assembly protein PilN
MTQMLSPDQAPIEFYSPVRERGDAAGLPRVNLLPTHLAEAAKLRRFQSLMVLVVVTALIAVGFFWNSAREQVNAANSQVAVVSVAQQHLEQQIAKYSYVDATLARIVAAEATLETALGGEIRYSRVLVDLSLTLAKGVQYTNLSITQAPVTPAPGVTGGLGAIQITGYAQSPDDVAALMTNLQKDPGLTDVTFTDTEQSQVGSANLYKFTVTCNLTPAMLSHRYTGATS